MTTIQKQLSRKIGNKEYAKYVLVIPPKIIKEAGLKEGTDVIFSIEGKKLCVEAKK